ncbi:hypothetical protein KBI52_27920 [Microvirga sp. HBU67558]|uniref:hypothetical protein n=1 Tax=Microvirga TaxID=186650 RepID=UPI001B3682EC|nr:MULTISPECIES: hypothetical protein [unclassified Microvirga]MBQ0824028.1 hypothetical protein [Microvirga sp. HBU67558]
MPDSAEDEQARFEALLAQALGDDDKILAHRATKNVRSEARHDAVRAKASFERQRDRPAKPRRRRPRRQE